MATSAAAAVAAAAGRARRQIRDHFEHAGALSREHAVSYEAPSRLYRRQFENLIGQGILKATGTGLFWMDRQAVELQAAKRRRRLKILLVIILASLVVATAISLALIRSR